MMRTLILLIYIIVSAGICLKAQSLVDNDTTSVDDEDQFIRENPEIEEFVDADIVVPDYINLSSNRIKMNGANWMGLKSALAGIDTTSMAIVHIGDSHLQADIATHVIRDYLQYDFGNAGRGLVAPLKMSGTNEPHDYVFSSKNKWKAAKLMKAPWSYTMGFTGTSVSPSSKINELSIGTVLEDDYNPFSSLTLFHKGKININRVVSESGRNIEFTAIPSKDYTQIYLSEPSSYVTLFFDSVGDLTVFGANLSGERPGIFYHTIGNNGATYSTYNRIGNLGAGIAPLHPELVIVSLGTNEAFGRVDNLEFYKSIDAFVKDIKSHNPEAQILLVTPMECQRRATRTVTRRNRRGRKYTVKQRTGSYSVNQNIRPIRETILRYGRDNGIAVYDWYEVAGGAGASSKWIESKLYGKDRVHHTSTGYKLQGKLLYDALQKEFEDITK